MSPSDEKEATDDYMEWLRLRKSGRLVKDTFTSDQLVTLAHQSGYTFVKGQMIRDWTRRDVFPSAPIAPTRSEGRFTGGQWPRVDAVRLLDTCWLHEQNCRGRALQLGLWLLSYAPLDGADPRELLVEQIERMEEVLFGQVLPADPAALGDEDQNRIAERIQQATEKPGRYLLDDLCAGLPVSLMSRIDPHVAKLIEAIGGDVTSEVIGPYFEELKAQHPEALAHTSVEELARFTTLLHAGDERLSPLPDVWAAMAPYLEERMRRLNQLLRLRMPPAPGVVERIIKDTSPQGDLPVSTIISEVLTALQRDLIHAILLRFAGLLPQLRQTLADASDGELREARNCAAPLLVKALNEQRHAPDPELTGLAQFSARAGRDVRRLFAAPAFFPLTAYLIAALIYGERRGRPPIVSDQPTGQAPPILIRRELLPVALDQFARLTRESTSRAEAFLAVVFSAIPPVREEVSD